MADNEKFLDRIKSEQQAFSRVTNKQLVCKDCKLRFDDTVKFGNTSKCKCYAVKPSKVLLGGSCNEYKKEQN